MKTVREAIPHIKPLIDERKARMEEFGDAWEGKPVRTGNENRLDCEMKLRDITERHVAMDP